MYKLLLCWRYLRTRYLAMACIISVMLGVATLIVVNSVMSGFSTKLKDRLHGLLSDVLIEAITFDGFADPAGKMQAIGQSLIGDKIEAMTATVEIFAMMQFRVGNGELITRPIRLIGIDPVGRGRVGGFAEYLVRQKESTTPSFDLPAAALERFLQHHPLPARVPEPIPIGLSSDSDEPPPPDPFQTGPKPPRGIIVGNAIACFRETGAGVAGRVNEVRFLHPGDDIFITTVSAGKLVPVFDSFVICDYFKSEMSEYDSNYVFVPLDYLQRLRAMEDRVTTIQIKLKNYARDVPVVIEHLEMMFPKTHFQVQSWEKKQGPLLAAIRIEKGILNILLFLIIAVAGFGILAIFSMIVVEKTRDIGILKALGASNRGVMAIFLGYGLLLGLVGAGLGTLLGLTITRYINEIEHALARLTGHFIFDPSVYYFNEIPTDIQPLSVLLVNVGAVGIAVLFSVLPALRAALLHPVRALRYE